MKKELKSKLLLSRYKEQRLYASSGESHFNATIQYNTIQYNTIQYNTIQYNTIQYKTIQYNTIQYNKNTNIIIVALTPN